MRIGHGYDVHRLTEGRKLILGGVDIPYEKGLLGHSDADVLAHAIMALALGDIGKLFPDNDPDYEGADSMKLMEKVISVMTEKGWKIGNIDSTICAQKPKLATYITSMRKRIAKACGCVQQFGSLTHLHFVNVLTAVSLLHHTRFARIAVIIRA